ncbi:MAG: Rrf2 family transcriptional regulator [Chitinophagaceae bacterium]
MLSQKAKYALQALGLLTARYEKGPVLISEIADQKKIPIKFLENILLELKHADILESYRGRTGGYALKVHPKSVKLSQIIRIVNGPIAMLSCVSLNFYKACDNCTEQICKINPVMAEARDAVLKILDRRTLADIRDEEF